MLSQSQWDSQVPVKSRVLPYPLLPAAFIVLSTVLVLLVVIWVRDLNWQKNELEIQMLMRKEGRGHRFECPVS